MHCLAKLLVTFVFINPFFAAAVFAQDLIASFDAATQGISGEWRTSDGKLSVELAPRSRAMLGQPPTASYALTVEFTRTAGEDSIGIVLPIGPSQCILNMSTFNGQAHGIGIIDGEFARSNDTTIRPGVLQNDHPYRLLIEVEVGGDLASIASQLDGRQFLQWSGRPESLTMFDAWKLPRADAIGLFTNSAVTFHAISLRPLDARMRMTKRPLSTNSPQPTVEFGGRQWNAANAQSATVEQFRGRQALHIRGREETFVYLPEVSFGDGIIEVDIASNTFSGIGFRGDPTGKVAEKLYFRPFNSTTAKHQNTVQYSMMGRPQLGWRALREQFPGRYESGADIKINEWFRARIEIRGRQLKAFVGDDTEPVLVVDELLGDRPSGLIGVWGWDSYFSNFKYTQADR